MLLAGMDSPAVTALLMEHHSHQMKRPQLLQDLLRRFVDNLNGEQRFALDRYYKDRLTEAAIAVQAQAPQDRIQELLTKLRDWLHDEIKAEPSLGVTFRWGDFAVWAKL